jgi:signal transduction histidine kinase
MVLLASPLMVAGLVATEYRGGGAQDAGGLLLVGVGGQCVLVLVFLLGSRIREKTGNESPWFFLLTYLIAGQLRVAFLVWGFALLSLPNLTPIWQRVMTSALLIPLVFGFSSYSWNALMRYLHRRRELVEQIAHSEIDLEQRRNLVASMRESFLRSVDDKVDQANRETVSALSTLEQRIVEGIEPGPELQKLLEEADSRWRGISHSTFEQARIRVPRPRFREFIDALVVSRPLSLWTILFGSLFVFSLAFARTLPLGEALVWGALWLAVFLPLTEAINTFVPRISRGRGLVFAAALGVLILSGLATLLIPGIGEAPHWGPFVIHTTVMLSALTIGMGPALESNSERVIEALRRHLDQSAIDSLRIESELVVLARKVAARLHAENRGEFLARILRLQRALDRGDTDEAIDELRSVREVLRNRRRSDDDIIDDDLMRFLENWRGLVDITTNLHTAIVPDHLHPAINTVVMDAVNDAIRHGQADWIEVKLETQGSEVVLTVSNNGREPEPSHVGGLGGATLDRLADGGWSREVDVLGFTRVKAKFLLK